MFVVNYRHCTFLYYTATLHVCRTPQSVKESIIRYLAYWPACKMRKLEIKEIEKRRMLQLHQVIFYLEAPLAKTVTKPI